MEPPVAPPNGLTQQEDEFRAKLRNFTLPTICKREIILIEDLLEWWRQNNRIERFLRAMAQERGWTDVERDRYVNTITQNTCFLLALSLLIQLRESHRIKRFIRSLRRHTEFSTISRQDVEDTTDPKQEWDSEMQFVNKFEAQKWPFRPPKLDHPLMENFQRTEILPLVKHKKIDNDNGAYASVYLVDIPAQFIGEKLAKLAAGYHFKIGQREYFQLAVKSLKSTNNKPYKDEIEAFGRLRRNQNMISFLGEFQYLESQSQPEAENSAHATRLDGPKHPLEEYNIVLEPAVCDLHTYLWQADIPIHQFEVETVWKLMFRLVDALVELHDVPSKDKREFGWHRDIKPNNVLLALNSDKNEWQFKLADPGCARFLAANEVKFVPVGPDKKLAVLNDVMVGSKQFGPPERSSDIEKGARHTQDIYQTYDIWSLGCVFSLVATWITMGQRGLHEYEWIRMEARQQIDSAYGDAFHDGEGVLNKVREWHRNIVAAARTWDKITPKIIKIIEEQMLIKEPEQRGTAKAIQGSLTQLLRQHTGSYVDTNSNITLSVEQQLQSTTFAQLFKLHDRNDLLLRLWQLPAYRDRGTGNVTSVHKMGGNVLTDRPNIPLITVEPVKLRSNSSFPHSKRSDSGAAFPWGPDIRAGQDVSTMGGPKSKDKTEDSRSPQLERSETNHSRKSVSSTTSSSAQPKPRSKLKTIIAATRAFKYSEVVRLSSGDQGILLERDESQQTLMDHLFDPPKSKADEFDKLFRLLYDVGVRLGSNAQGSQRKKFEKQERKQQPGRRSSYRSSSST